MLRPPIKSPGQRLRDLFKEDTLVMPGAFSALSALSAANAGAKAIYLSGGAMTNSQLGVPDIALMTLNEMSQIAAQVCQVVQVPVISDADTGFGTEWNVARTVIEFERAGLAGIHIEDQVSPKRCGHLDGKEVIKPEEMCDRIKAAVTAKSDPSFMVIARTDARGVNGLTDAISRAKAYAIAGADAIFPEGLENEDEFIRFRSALAETPLLANMTEFGKTPLIPASRFQAMKYEMVIFPVTALRVMLKSLDTFYADLIEHGTQKDWLDKMVTRQELYERVEYKNYQQ